MEKITQIEQFCTLKPLDEELDNLKEYLKEASNKEESVHEVEKEILGKILKIGYQSLGWFLKQQGQGDMGEKIDLPGGKKVRRLEETHHRGYQSIFGRYELLRYVYGSREGQKIECIPLDAKLNLPEGDQSYLLQDWSQTLTVESPFNKVSVVLKKILSLKVPVDSLERTNKNMAKSVPQYRESKPVPKPEEEGEIIVVSADAKGVPIRHSKDQAKIYDHERKRGPKPDRKKMAVVGAVYSVDRYKRTPKEVTEALFREPGEQEKSSNKRPCPQHKQVLAYLTQTNGEKEIKATELVFDWMAEQVEQRNPGFIKEQAILMDGQPSLWEASKEHFPDQPLIEILDLLHATPRLWDAAHIFCANDKKQRLEFIYNRVLRVLHGEVSLVIRGFRQMATKRNIPKKKRKKLDKICSYLYKNKHRMQYDLYLAAGYPIASGVIEGACRHFVKDRMERAGMRWSIAGAQAMLDLRATCLNGDWEDFTQFRIASEQQRLYPYRGVLKETVDSMAA